MLLAHHRELIETLLDGARAMREFARRSGTELAIVTDMSAACGSQVISDGCRLKEQVACGLRCNYTVVVTDLRSNGTRKRTAPIRRSTAFPSMKPRPFSWTTMPSWSTTQTIPPTKCGSYCSD